LNTHNKNRISNSDDLLQKAQELFLQKDFPEALGLLHRVLDRDPHNEKARLALARCQLALEQFEAAIDTYTQLLDKRQNPTFATQAEAELVLGKTTEALKHFEAAAKYDPENADTQFLLSVASYLEGFISHTYHHLKNAVSMGFEWADDDPLDFVAQYVLMPKEFFDFEQIYLDAQESVAKNQDVTRNRWFSLNMPIYELFSASDPDKKLKRAEYIKELIAPHWLDFDFSHGEKDLEIILKDFSKSEVDATFGLEAQKQIQEKQYSQVAGLILSLQLEHLRQLAGHFALTATIVDSSHLQNVVVMLPLPMAMALMVLYAASDPKDQLLKMVEHNIPENILAGLIALSFSVFYHSLNKYRSSEKEPITKSN